MKRSSHRRSRAARILFSLALIATATTALAHALTPTAPDRAEPVAAPTARASDADSKLFDYRDITLENGLRVVTLEDFSCPIVAVHLWYHVGSKDENPERQGFAHMFEHMMFQGTDRLGPTGHFDNVHRVGGDCNAYTNFDNTTYIQTVPANQLSMVMYLEAERMSFLRIDQKSFDTERKVVEEERRLGLNGPYGTLAEQILPAMFKQHPYRWSPIGKIPHLRASSVQDLRDFWTKYYVPNNATLVVVGAVKHEDAQAQAKKAFGWIPKGPDPDRVSVREPIPSKARSITIKEQNAPAPIVGIGFPGVPLGHKDSYPLSILTTILGGGESSRLYRELVADKQLAVYALSGAFSLENHGITGAAAVLSPIKGNTKRVMKALEAQIERIRTEPVTADELLKGKNQLLQQVVTQNLTVSSKASVLGQAAVLEGDITRVNRQFDDIRAVTIEDVQRVAKEYFAPERALKITVERNLLGTLLGGKKNPEEDSLITAAPEESSPPPGRPGVRRPDYIAATPPRGGLLPFKASPEFQTATLDNGLRVVCVPNHEVPYVTAQLGLLAGTWCEPKTGVASMTLSMLTKGTTAKSEGDLAKELDTYAISLSGGAGADSSSVTAACVTDQIDHAVKLLAEVVLTPTFPAKEFEKLRTQVRTGLAISTNEPAYVADRELRQRLYGSHPYARTTTGETADVDALKSDDLAPWWTQYARPDMATLIFAGDIELPLAVDLAKANFSAWKASSDKPAVALPEIPKPEQTRIYLVDRPGSVQSQIRMAKVGMTRKDPRYATASVVGSYFGGAFGSRLNETIRVKKGLTYGAGGGFRAQRFAGQFSINTFSKTASTAAALQAAFDEVDRLRNEPPSSDELDISKSSFLGGFAGERETPQAVAGDVWLLETNGLDAEYFNRIVSGISGSTSDQCTGLVQDMVDPSKMIVVVVGDARQLKADLEKIAPVTVVTPQDKAAEVENEDKDDAKEVDKDEK